MGRISNKQILSNRSYQANYKYYYKNLFSAVIITFMLLLNFSGCGNNSNPTRFNNSELSEDCKLGFCDSDKELTIEKSEESFDSENGGSLEIEDKISVIIPPNALAEDSKIIIINGIDFDNLGVNDLGIPNKKIFDTGIIFPIATFEVISESAIFQGSMRLELKYSLEYIETINSSLKESVLGFTGFTEDDLAVQYFYKKTGRWISLQGTVDRVNKSVIVNSQYIGIYAIAISPEAYKRLGDYINDNPDKLKLPENSEEMIAKKSTNVSCSVNNSIANDSNASGYPDLDGDEDGWDGYTSACSKQGVYIDQIFFRAFNSSCYSHDWCYRYGEGTYNYSRAHCDMSFYNDTSKGCDPTNIASMPKRFCTKRNYFFGFMRICVPNPKYIAAIAARGATYFPCRIASLTMYGAVVAKGEPEFRHENSGCYDYENRGVFCGVAKVRSLNVKDSSGNLVTNLNVGEEYKITAKVMSTKPEGVLSEVADSISWEISPELGTLSTTEHTDSKETVLTVPTNTPPGNYTITAKIHYDGVIQHTFNKEVRVVTPNIETEFGVQKGAKDEDWGEQMAVASDGSVYAIRYSDWYVRKKVGRKCKKIFWVSYSCKNVYRDYREWGRYITKYSVDGNVQWEIPLGKVSVNDITVVNGDLLMLTGNTLHRYSDSGEKIKTTDVSGSGYWGRALHSSTGSNYFIVYEGGNPRKIVTKIYNENDISTGEIFSAVTGYSYRSSYRNDTGLFIAGFLKGTYGGADSLSISKFDLLGNLQWSKTESVPASLTVSNISASATGDVYIAGYLPLKYIEGGTDGRTVPFVMGFDPFGNKKWASAIPTAMIRNVELAVLSTGEIVAGAHKLIDGKPRVIIYRFDNSGSVLQSRLLYETNYNYLQELLIYNDNLFVIGRTNGNMFRTNAGKSDLFLLKSNNY